MITVEEAERLQESINQKIKDHCATLPPYCWHSTAEHLVSNDIRLEGWDFMWMTPIGNEPQVVLTQYTPEEYRS